MSSAQAAPPPPNGGLPKGVLLKAAPPASPTLLHFSEDPGITVFEPRPVASNPDSEPLVWAIDEAHAPLYYFPRDCPRVCFWALPSSSPEDVDRYLGVTDARIVIAIEGAWLERVRETTLYVYRFDAAAGGFVSLEDHGAHVSRRKVAPISVEPVGDLLTRLRDAGVEVRLTPSLWPLRAALLNASLHYSMIRMRNAAAPPSEKDQKT
jgi:hypothetical protein